MQKISIEEMTEQDIVSISPILSSDFDDFWTIEQLKSELENLSSHCFVAKIQDEIVGFAVIWQVIDTIHLNDIVTKKDFRNLGIGSALLEHLINISKSLEGATCMTLEVDESNVIAQKLYKKYDFKEIGIRKNYYGINKNALIMTKAF